MCSLKYDYVIFATVAESFQDGKVMTGSVAGEKAGVLQDSCLKVMQCNILELGQKIHARGARVNGIMCLWQGNLNIRADFLECFLSSVVL